VVALSKDLMSRPVAALDALLVAHAQLLFSRNRWVGVLVLAAAASVPRCMLLGLVALLAAMVAMRALGLAHSTNSVPYGYNALLVGYAIASAYALDATSVSLTVAMGVLSALVSVALGSLAGYFGWLPVLSLPFIVTSWFTLGVAPHLSLASALPTRPAWPALPDVFTHVLQALGGCVLLPTVSAGVCVLAALLVHSRIASLLAVGAGLVVVCLLEFMHAPVPDSLSQLAACNAALAAIALGGVWIVPSRRSFVLGLFAALLATFFALGLSRPLLRLGLSLSFVPWNAAVIVLLSALRQRVGDPRQLRLATFAAESPERLLLADIPERALAGEPTAVPLHLPFLGVWSCTQGIDGAYTHRGLLRHAFDFEVYGDVDGSLCTGDGQHVSDYRCFGLPVLATADGIVAAIEHSVPNNAIGEVSRDKPWGNHVTLQHAAELYSVVAHLAPSTIAVYPGQFVRRGALLGYLGNSGRSPRPHLHFQLQGALRLGSPTLPCRFVDVVVRTGDQTRFEPGHVPSEGEGLRALEPDYALAGYFDVPVGARFTYRIGEQFERIESALDAWGRPILRSLEYRSELLLARGESYFASAELTGSQRSVLAALRLCLARVPYERDASLGFRSLLPQRWLGGWLRGLHWDLTAAFTHVPGIELNSRLEVAGDRLTVRGSSCERTGSSGPLLQTRAVLIRGVGPTLIELIIDGRAQRAELLTAGPRALLTNSGARSAVHPALGLGDWS
jgi:urea transporter